MLNLICNLIEKIVFSGIDGKILVIPFLFLLWTVSGIVVETIEIVFETIMEGIK